MGGNNLVKLAVILAVCSLIHISSGQSSCRNPNGKSGSCISIYSCPALLSVLQKKPLLETDKQFAAQSQCTSTSGQINVCCTGDVGFTDRTTTPVTTVPPTTRTVTTSMGSGEGAILPALPRCGQLPAGDRIYNGNDTLLDEYPWMALLEYVQSNGKRIFNCGGSLINQRYVITAAHCVTGSILREVGRLDSVRLGEYDLSTEVDCVRTDCADPVINIKVEDTIPHPGFDESTNNRHNDIALVRLANVITYTDFIKPVCLPSALGIQATPRTGTNLVVAGWGRTLTSRQSNIKQKLYIPVNDFQECADKFATKKIQLTTSQICVGGNFVEDSCDGDSGGPLMREQGNLALEGVVSFGNRCGLEGWPGVYTKVADFEPWIKSNIRP